MRKDSKTLFLAIVLVSLFAGVLAVAFSAQDDAARRRHQAQEVGRSAVIRSVDGRPDVSALPGFVREDAALFETLSYGHGEDAVFALPIPNGTTVVVEKSDDYWRKVRVLHGELAGQEFYLSDRLTSYQWLQK